MKIINGTAYTIRPCAFSRSGLGASDAYWTEEAVERISVTINKPIF